jgi:hypothetical protein
MTLAENIGLPLGEIVVTVRRNPRSPPSGLFHAQLDRRDRTRMSHWYVFGFVKLDAIGQHIEILALRSPASASKSASIRASAV